MPSARVIVDDRFRQFGADTQRGIERALGRAASITVAAARGAGSEYQIGSIQGSIKATSAHRIRKGWRIFVYADDFRAILYEKGTYSRRRSKLSSRYHRTAKAEAIAAEAGTGVKAQRFLAKALVVGRVALLREVQRELGRR